MDKEKKRRKKSHRIDGNNVVWGLCDWFYAPSHVYFPALWCPYHLLPRLLIVSFSLFLRTDGYTREEIRTHMATNFLRNFPKYLVPRGKVLIKMFSTWGMELWMDPRRTGSWELPVQIILFKTSVTRPLNPNLASFKLTRVRAACCPGQPCSLDFITRRFWGSQSWRPLPSQWRCSGASVRMALGGTVW